MSFMLFPLTIYLVASKFISLPDLKTFSTPEGQLAFLDFARLYQILVMLLVMALPCLILSWLIDGRWFSFSQLTERVPWKIIGLGALVVVLSYPFIGFLYGLMQEIRFPSNWQLNEMLQEQDALEKSLFTAFATDTSLPGIVLTTVMITIVPAFCEELLFRGTFQRLLSQSWKKAWIAVVLAAVFFSLMHLSPYGFLPRMVVGVLLGYLFYWSGSLWVPVAAHFAFNAIQLPVLYTELESGTLGDTGSSMPWLLALASLVLTALALHWFYRVCMQWRIKETARVDTSDSSSVDT
jgi:hypothetical protein